MPRFTTLELKESIMKVLTQQDRAHKMNLIGRGEEQRGNLEAILEATFTAEERLLAVIAFESLKRDDHIRSTFDDLADPDNWVRITDSGRQLLTETDGLARAQLADIALPPLPGPTRAVPALTLDANCIISAFDPNTATPTSLDALEAIVTHALAGRCSVAITTRLEADLQQDRNVERRAGLMQVVRMLPVLGTISSPVDTGEALREELQRILFPGLTEADPRYVNKENDIRHLAGHKLHERDIFVTDDRGIWGKAVALRRSPGVVVMTPGACVDYLARIEAQQHPKVLASESNDPAYASTGLSGTVTFDYSNNDHRYTIGSGLFLFETMWGKASDTSVHAYTDAASISGIAVAKGVREIAEVSDAGQFDYSSRARTAAEGQVLIWRNVNGFYAATKVLDVRDDSRQDDRDELTLEYVIQADGSSSFA